MLQRSIQRILIRLKIRILPPEAEPEGPCTADSVAEEPGPIDLTAEEMEFSGGMREPGVEEDGEEEIFMSSPAVAVDLPIIEKVRSGVKKIEAALGASGDEAEVTAASVAKTIAAKLNYPKDDTPGREPANEQQVTASLDEWLKNEGLADDEY